VRTLGRPDLPEADLLVTAEVSPEQERAVVDAFGELGVVARARVVPPRRSPSELQWLILAAVPLLAFLSSVASKLAEDAYQGLKRLVGRALGDQLGPATSDRVLVLQDTTTRLQVVLEADLPADAYRQLVKLDLSAIRQGPVHYDRQRGQWRSELDQWRRRQTLPGG
jgi:hypothetical protein